MNERRKKQAKKSISYLYLFKNTGEYYVVYSLFMYPFEKMKDNPTGLKPTVKPPFKDARPSLFLVHCSVEVVAKNEIRHGREKLNSRI